MNLRRLVQEARRPSKNEEIVRKVGVRKREIAQKFRIRERGKRNSMQILESRKKKNTRLLRGCKSHLIIHVNTAQREMKFTFLEKLYRIKPCDILIKFEKFKSKPFLIDSKNHFFLYKMWFHF